MSGLLCKVNIFLVILSLYLRALFEKTGSSDPEATASTVYHAWIVVAYVMPLMGAYLADTMLGKFKTILYLSVIYIIGIAIMAFAALPANNNGIPGM